jgi:ABC-type branched-subunit amino acid transport system substrate-binding protein
MLLDKLITHDKVDMLPGGFGSSQVMASSAVAERNHYPLISGAASSNELFNRGCKYYLPTRGSAKVMEGLQRMTLSKVAVFGMTPKRLIVVHVQIPLSAGFKR